LDPNHQNNVTIFFSSHALNKVSNLCNRIAIIDKGQLVAEGNIDELRKLIGNPSENYVITVLNWPSTQKVLSNLPLKVETNTVTMKKGC
jgi:ABC-type multidrug transport system ATPase subunit